MLCTHLEPHPGQKNTDDTPWIPHLWWFSWALITFVALEDIKFARSQLLLSFPKVVGNRAAARPWEWSPTASGIGHGSCIALRQELRNAGAKQQWPHAVTVGCRGEAPTQLWLLKVPKAQVVSPTADSYLGLVLQIPVPKHQTPNTGVPSSDIQFSIPDLVLATLPGTLPKPSSQSSQSTCPRTWFAEPDSKNLPVPQPDSRSQIPATLWHLGSSWNPQTLLKFPEPGSPETCTSRPPKTTPPSGYCWEKGYLRNLQYTFRPPLRPEPYKTSET